MQYPQLPEKHPMNALLFDSCSTKETEALLPQSSARPTISAGRSLLTVFRGVAFAMALIAFCQPLFARTLLKNICRVKGQEENRLRGLGLVVGLKGTGDSGDNLPTMRALARAMELMGNPVSRIGGLEELKKTKSVALAWVSATVPGVGGRRGDKIDCSVSVMGDAKSLEGGRLVFAALQSMNLKDPRVYAFAQGRVQLDNSNYPVEGRIYQGAILEEDIFNPFSKDGHITLVLDKNHAHFQVAHAVAQAINTQLAYSGNTAERPMREVEEDEIATPIDQANILVQIPSFYKEAPVQFVAEVLDLPIFDVEADARVVINERAGSIVIGGDVEIGSVVVTHKNIVIEADAGVVKPFIAVDPEQQNGPRLKSLVEALNKVQVPNADIIEIIKGLDRNGKLHGKLIIE